MLARLVAGVREQLDANYAGADLQGSLATGGFDDASDLGFLIVVEQKVSADAVEQILDNPAEMSSWWYQAFAVLSYCRMAETRSFTRYVVDVHTWRDQMPPRGGARAAVRELLSRESNCVGRGRSSGAVL